MTSKQPHSRKYIQEENLKENEIQWIEEMNIYVGDVSDGAAADSAATPIDGEFRDEIKPEYLEHVKSAYFVFGKASSAGDDVTDIILRDYTAASDIATVSVTGASNREETAVSITDLTQLNQIGLKATVTSASATGGATFSVLNAKLVLVCGVS